MKRQRRLIRLPEVIELTGLQKSEIYERAKAGRFPRQVLLGENTKAVAWVLDEVLDYVNELIAKRDERDAKRLAFSENGRAEQ